MIETNFIDTEIGCVPADWAVVSLGEIGEVRMCKRVMKYQTSEKGEIPFFKIGTFGKTPDAYISRELYSSYKEKYNYPKKGDILLSAAGTIGRTVVFDGKPSYFQDSNIVWIENDEKKVYNELLFYIYKNLSWVTESGTIPRIYNGIVRSIVFAIPSSLPEQHRIASALSSIDNLISALDKLIEKKCAIKTGTMQELLGGERRVKGCEGEWKNISMKDIVIENGSVLNSKDFESGNIPVIAGGKKPAGFHKYFNRKGKTITISASGASAGFVSYYDTPIFASDCSTISEQEDIDLKFLYFSLVVQQDDIYKCQAGGAQPHVHAKDIQHIKVSFPPLPEQRAIASVLTAMDDELAALEAKKAKYIALKQGMMQQLLTGKIRLVDSSAK